MDFKERDFDAVPELAALVADLLDELQSLRAPASRWAGIIERAAFSVPNVTYSQSTRVHHA